MIPEQAAPNEIVTTRLFKAPRELVFRVFTDVEHVSNWWGPNGFRTTTHSRDFKVGGAWLFTMHGPDGTDFPNRIVYQEIVPSQLLRYVHDDGSDAENAQRFNTSVRFDDLGGKTLVTMRARFRDAHAKNEVLKFGADEGGRQTLARLAGVVAAKAPAAQEKAFVLSRVFDAPRELVYQVHTDPKHFAKWFGPKGVPVARCEMDMRAGGLVHYGLQTPDGNTMWGKWHVLEVTPPSRLVVISSFSDEKAGVTRHPMSKDWPLHTLSEATFEDEGGKTRLTIRWQPFEATEIEQATFDQSHDSMRAGWSGSFEQLEAYLASLTPRA